VQRNKNGFTNSAIAGYYVALCTRLTEPLPALPATQIGDFKMNDMFGKIIVTGDYEGDLKAIVDVLNSLRWSYGYLRGEKHKWGIKRGIVYNRPGVNREIIVQTGDILFPRLRPIGDIFVLKDGRRCFADDADESFIAQWKADKDDGAKDWDKYTLNERSYFTAPERGHNGICSSARIKWPPRL